MTMQARDTFEPLRCTRGLHRSRPHVRADRCEFEGGRGPSRCRGGWAALDEINARAYGRKASRFTQIDYTG